MKVKVEEVFQKHLVGLSIDMSLSDNKTKQLWQSFGPRIGEIPHRKGKDSFAIQFYKENSLGNFGPNTLFKQCAAIEVQPNVSTPDGMEKFTINTGLYAMTIHHGLASEFHKTVSYIMNDWLPNSDFQLDDRPYFQVMNSNYNPMDPLATEETYFPIKPKL